MKNFFKDHREKIVDVAGIILIVASIGCFVTGCIVYSYYDGYGGWWFVSTIVLMLIAMVSNHSDFGGLGMGLLYIMLLVFGFVPFRQKPTVTECSPLLTSNDGVIYKMMDTRTFCFDTDSTRHFTLISSDTLIGRSNKCTVCGETYDKHCFRLLSPTQLARKQEEKSTLQWMLETPPNY